MRQKRKNQASSIIPKSLLGAIYIKTTVCDIYSQNN